MKPSKYAQYLIEHFQTEFHCVIIYGLMKNEKKDIPFEWKGRLLSTMTQAVSKENVNFVVLISNIIKAPEYADHQFGPTFIGQR